MKPLNDPLPDTAWSALKAAWKRDLPAVLNGCDPHLYPALLSGWPIADTMLAEVLNAVADYYNVDPSDLKSKTRRRQFTEPRQMYCHIAKRKTAKSLAQIGTIIGRDPTTVLHGARAIATRRKAALSIQRAAAAIEARLE
jgi:hypothetical protein